MKFSSVRGTRDILNIDAEIMRFIEDTARNAFQLFNYAEIRTPIFEETGLFIRSIGESTDIVEKEMYTFADKKGRSLTLRPEGTAPVVRAYLESHQDKKESVARFYYMGPMFRYERPQAGRYRQFWQIGAELFGLHTPFADAEIILLNTHILNHIGVTGHVIHLNSVGCENCRSSYKKALITYASTLQHDLCENCRKRLNTNPLRILDCKIPGCKKLLASAPRIIDFLDQPCRDYMHQTVALLQEAEIPQEKIIIDPSLVRGLDYYTGVVFECTASGLGSQDAISAGGRYNNLVEELGGSAVPAVGFALGVDRLAELLSASRPKTKMNAAQTFIACMTDPAFKKGFALAHTLRERGIPAYIDLQKKNLTSQLSFASEKGFLYAVILGEDELHNNYYTVKNLAEKTQQRLQSLTDLITKLMPR